jgi:phage terminase large subunit-like protein
LALAEKVRRGTVEPARERRRAPAAVADRPAPADSGPEQAPIDYTAIAIAYADDIIAGRIVACQWVIKACRRFRRDLKRAAGAECAFSWSPAHVQDVCSWIARLPHVEGRWGSPTLTLQPWQVWMLAACYGFRMRSDGRRRVTAVFFQVSRKSAKSTLVAAVALYHLAVEREPGGQVICGASTGSQARIVFAIAQKMIRRSLWLRELGFTVMANAIIFGDDGSMRPINAKSSTQDGLNPSFISLDESHAQDFSLHDVLKSAMGARPDAAMWAPTTAGYSLTSVGFALRSTAMKILDEVIESDHTFAVLYELDPDDDWRNEHVWVKSAPMIGISPSLEWVRRYRDDAIATPGMEAEFQTKVANRWLHSAQGWLSMAAWDGCADRTLTIDRFRGRHAYVAADLAERDDIAAVAIAFEEDGIIYGFVKGYLPELVVAERSRAVPEYVAWLRSGELTPTPGNMTDYSIIEADIRELCDTFEVQAIVLERYGALNLAANLANSGLPARIESKNAKVFTAPAKELEARVKAGRFRHTGSSFLTWQASNVCVERRRDGSLLTTKDRAGSANKIDGIDALLLALSALLEQPAAQPEPSIILL